MSERTLLERSTAEKAAVVEKPQDKTQDKPVDVKSADVPAETAASRRARRHQVAPRDKTAIRSCCVAGAGCRAVSGAPARREAAVRLPPSHLTIIVMPMILRARRSNGCASTTRSRTGDRRVPEAARIRRHPAW